MKFIVTLIDGHDDLKFSFGNYMDASQFINVCLANYKEKESDIPTTGLVVEIEKEKEEEEAF